MTNGNRDDFFKTAKGCVDIVFSPDDGGWYAQEYDFTRRDNATRTTKRIYPSREALIQALHGTTASSIWGKWD